MPPRDWPLRISDILEAIEKIERFTYGMSFESFSSDDRTIDAVLYNFAVIGEAARHVPSEIERQYSSLPLADMRGMRNVIVHDYPGIDLRIIWATIHSNLPSVVSILANIIDGET